MLVLSNRTSLIILFIIIIMFDDDSIIHMKLFLACSAYSTIQYFQNLYYTGSTGSTSL